MTPRIQRRTCPLCISPQKRELHTVARKGDRYNIQQCLSCRLVYVTDPPADTASHIEPDRIHWHRNRHRQVRRLLLRHLAPNARIIDIGCGRGELGYIMRDDPIEYVGFEPARSLSDFARQHGVTVYPEPFTGQLTADAVVLDNVLEHVLHPLRLFNTAVSNLRDGGLVVVIVPNRNDIRQLSRRWRDRHLWIPPDHINYFSSTNVTDLFRACGLCVRHFGIGPLRTDDYKFFLRGALEVFGISIFGHNVYAIKPPTLTAIARR